MAGQPWRILIFILVHFLGTVTSQGPGASTLQQFLAFVGGRSESSDVGRTFQEATRSAARGAPAGAVFLARDDVADICEIIDYNCDPRYPYRTADGSCNNLNNPTWGKAVIPMRRWIPPAYGDGISTPRTKGKYGQDLPGARYISTTVHGIEDDKTPKEPGLTHMMMQWGHFLDHDITHAPPVKTMDDCCAKKPGSTGFSDCFPIPIPSDDPFFEDKTCMHFIRSIQVPNVHCTLEPVEQVNDITAFVDSSNVYGSGDKDDLRLKEDVAKYYPGVKANPVTNVIYTGPKKKRIGLLRTDEYDLLPPTDGGMGACDAPCFDAGDIRRNEQMGLTSMHTLFHREHNRIARTLKKYNPFWDDERLFQEARKIVGAIAQKITYSDWLKIVLDSKTRHKYGIDSPKSGYSYCYDSSVDPSIRNAFGAAALRFGHTLVRAAFTRRKPNYSINRIHFTSDIFGKTSLIRNSFGRAVGEFLRGLIIDKMGKFDRFITPELRNKLFKSPNNSLDLVALNIQRGRDHGTAPYNAWREWCGLPKAKFFGTGPGGFTDHSSETVRQLDLAYGSPDDVDLFPGAVSEKTVPGGILGPTFACLIGRQFEVLKIGDRFWYELNRKHTGFTPGQLREIRKASLGRIICDNTSTFYLQKNVFKKISRKNLQKSCYLIPKVDLSQWQEHRYKY